MYSWNSNDFGSSVGYNVKGTVLAVNPTSPFISASGDHHDILIIESLTTSDVFKEENNYYSKGVIYDGNAGGRDATRIISSKYLGESNTANKYLMQLVIEHVENEIRTGSNLQSRILLIFQENINFCLYQTVVIILKIM